MALLPDAAVVAIESVFQSAMDDLTLTQPATQPKTFFAAAAAKAANVKVLQRASVAPQSSATQCSLPWIGHAAGQPSRGRTGRPQPPRTPKLNPQAYLEAAFGKLDSIQKIMDMALEGVSAHVELSSSQGTGAPATSAEWQQLAAQQLLRAAELDVAVGVTSEDAGVQCSAPFMSHTSVCM